MTFNCTGSKQNEGLIFSFKKFPNHREIIRFQIIEEESLLLYNNHRLKFSTIYTFTKYTLSKVFRNAIIISFSFYFS